MERIEDGLFLMLGSNLGERKEMLLKARLQLETETGNVLAVSSFYETEPWGLKEQPLFINQLLVISASADPLQLLDKVLKIEAGLGRDRSKSTHWGERVIDIDILYYGNRVVELPGLQIPHPRLQERRFVLVPLCEVAPDFIHPVSGLSSKAMLDRCLDPLDVKKL